MNRTDPYPGKEFHVDEFTEEELKEWTKEIDWLSEILKKQKEERDLYGEPENSNRRFEKTETFFRKLGLDL